MRHANWMEQDERTPAEIERDRKRHLVKLVETKVAAQNRFEALAARNSICGTTSTEDRVRFAAEYEIARRLSEKAEQDYHDAFRVLSTEELETLFHGGPQ